MLYRDWPCASCSAVLASSHQRRANSHALPWTLLLPDFSDTLMMPPAVRPYCASYVLVMILNSCTASTGGTYAMLLPPWIELFGAPSSRNSLLRFFPPLTDQSAIAPLSNGR